MEIRAASRAFFLNKRTYNCQVANWGVKSSLVYPLQVGEIKANSNQTSVQRWILLDIAQIPATSTITTSVYQHSFILHNFAQTSQFLPSIMSIIFSHK